MDEQERQQLNREIAEALGWKLHFYTAETHLNSQWQLENPDGKVVTGYRSSYGQTEETEWNELLPIYIPNFAADLNAVADALKGKPVHLTLGFERPCSARLVHESENPIYPTDILTDEYYATGETVEHAAAKATLSWALATKARAT